MNETLPANLIRRILQRLGLTQAPENNLAGLHCLYSAWCTNIPFDNIAKRLHLGSGKQGPLPGNDAELFFTTWLQYNIGGLCWAGSNALYILLRSLGFSAHRCLATMTIAPGIPPNHGTVVVDMGSHSYLVDTSLLHEAPLLLSRTGKSAIDHPAWGVTCRPREGKYHLRTRLLHMAEGCECRIDMIGAKRDDFLRFNEETRDWSPFNYSLYVRINRANTVTGIAYGRKVLFDVTGLVKETECGLDCRSEFLVNELNVDKNLLSRLPPDSAMVPPPSRTTT